MRVRRTLFLLAGGLFFAIGFAGMFVPLLPTVVFWIIAAGCFGRSSPRLEARLLRDPTIGPHILAWRQRGAISLRGKVAATGGLVASSAVALLAWHLPLSLAPMAACLLVGLFIWTRPD